MRCSVKSANERNPRCVLQVSRRTAGIKPEEGGDDVKSAWPLCLGLHTRYNGQYNGLLSREVEPIPQNWPQFRLQAATRLHEAGVASNRRSAYGGEYVPGACTHRPSRHESWQHPKPVGQPAREAAVEGGVGDWDEVVTR